MAPSTLRKCSLAKFESNFGPFLAQSLNWSLSYLSDQLRDQHTTSRLICIGLNKERL